MNRPARNSHARIDDGPTTGPSRLMALVLMARDCESGLRYALPNGESVIGRRPDCDLVLDAPAIAPRHARVFCVDDRAVLRSLAAEYPVHVNGAPVDRCVLAGGDEIQLAHYRLRFVAPGRPGGSAPPVKEPGPPPPASDANAGDAVATTPGDATTAAPEVPGGPVPSSPVAGEVTVAIEAAWPDEPGGSDPVAGVAGGREPAEADPESAEAPADREAAPPAEPGDAPPVPAEDSGPGTARAADSGRPAGQDAATPPSTAWVWGSGGVASPPPEAGRDPDPEDAPPPETAAASGTTGEVTGPASPPRAFHLDILCGINQGRRVTLTHERAILGFDRERLVEIRTAGDDLWVRRIDDQAEARLNDEPISDASTTAAPGDVLSVQRIDMRIHRDTGRHR